MYVSMFSEKKIGQVNNDSRKASSLPRMVTLFIFHITPSLEASSKRSDVTVVAWVLPRDVRIYDRRIVDLIM